MAQSEFDAFLGLILSLGVNYETSGKLGWKDEETYDPFISWDWITGGLTGGNCWGSSADTPVSSEDEPDCKEFDQILEAICPTVTFIQYRQIERECMSTREYSQGEYYGNYYNKKQKVLDLKTLYNSLQSRGLL